MDDAAGAAAGAVARLPADPSDRAFCLSVLVQVQLAQFEQTGQLLDLERAVETQRRAVACFPADEPDRAVPAADLAMILVRRYEMAGGAAALGEAQAVIAEAVALTAEGSFERHVALAVQAMIRSREYERTGVFELLMAAEEEAEEVIAALPAGHFMHQFALSAMGLIGLRRYERTGKQATLDRAITVLRQAVETSDRRHYLRPGWLSMLGICVGRRFERTGDAADLDDAIDLMREGATLDLQDEDRPALRYLAAELGFLTRHFPPGPANHQLIGPAASCAAATVGIADHDWIHFACHAGPLDSDDGTVNRGFVFWDGDLTITDLAAQPERRGGMAFLSACQTAAGSDEHPDEALHLAAAMQFIGYSHVVATMWSIKDDAAPLAAEAFYTMLSQEGHDTTSALRTAIIGLREETDPTNPFIWAPYAHYGY